MADLTHDYQPWAGALAVEPVPCPCCGGKSEVWQYIEEPGAAVLRVVMCAAPEFDDDKLPMLISTCPLNMPHNSFYCQTARSAVDVWNRYAAALTAARGIVTRQGQDAQRLGGAAIEPGAKHAPNASIEAGTQHGEQGAPGQAPSGQGSAPSQDT